MNFNVELLSLWGLGLNVWIIFTLPTIFHRNFGKMKDFANRLSLCFYDAGSVFNASLQPEFSAFRLPAGS